jgi:hypothetical protein
MRKNYIGLLRRKETTDNPKKNIYGSSPSRNGWLMGMFAAATLLLGGNSYAQTNIANYTFTKSTGATYTPITGGTKLFPSAGNTTYDNEVSTAITLPTATPFTYGGVVVTTVYVSANGFITFGAAPSGSTYTPLSTLDGTGAISAFGQDGGFSSSDTTQPIGNHEVRYQDLGTEFVVQWQDHANYFNRATERLNFQIRLNYATGAINIIYGNCTDPGTVSTSGTTVYVGIRGNSTTYATNVNNLRLANVPAGTTCDWSNAVTGYDNTSTSSLLFSGTTNVNMKIPNGLQFTWTPGTQLPVRTFAATSAITTGGATLNWTAPTGATSYNVQYRLPGTCAWTDWSGNPVSTNSAVLTGLDQGTTYQARIQALNGSAQSIYSHIPNAAGTGDGYSLTGTFKTLANCASTVTGLASSAITPDTATITWTASTTAPANGYEYYYSTSSAIPVFSATASGSTAAGVVTTNLSGLTPSTQYYFWVRTNCDGVNKGAWSSTANFTTLGLCPAVTAPAANATNVSLTPTITWTAISGATGYKVNVGTTSGGTNIVANADVTTGTSYAIATPLNNSTIYYYSVTAYTATTAAPATPCAIRSFTTILLCTSTVTGLASSAITPNTATISWTASTAAPANGYEYYYATTNTAPNIATTPSGSTAAGVVTTNLSGLTPSTQYYYWVRTNCNGTDKGAWSSSANFTTLGLCPTVTAPTAGATGVSTTPTITWTAISGAIGYKVNVGTTSGGTDIVANADVTTGTSYAIATPLINNTLYYYSVTAYTAITAAPVTPCTIRSFTTILSCPSTVTGLASSAITPNTATISWTASTTPPANGYEYYYATTNTAPTVATTPSGSTAAGVVTASLSGLTPSTQYYYWVRTNCNGTDKGAWSSSANFTTLGLCPTVTAPTANATGVSITPTITWTAISGVTGYKVNVGTTSGGSDIVANADVTAGTSYAIATPLSNATQYYYSVTAYTATTAAPATPCTIRSFTTILSCPSTVTGLASSAVTVNTATISWTASTTPPANGYEYYYATTNTVPTAATTPSGSTAAGVVTAGLSGLAPSTQYYYWVRTNCNGTDKGVWSSSATFTTACSVLTPAYTNNFNTVPGACWSNTDLGGSPATGSTSTGSALWVEDGFLNSGSTGSIRCNIYDGFGSRRIGWLKSPVFNLSSGGYRVKFDYGLTNFNVATSGTLGSDDIVQFVVSQDGGSTWTVLRTWNAANSPSNTSTAYSLDLTSYTSANTRFAFFSDNGPVGDANDVDFFIDNFTVETIPSLGTVDAIKKDNVKIYPNPFSDVLNISDVKNVKSISIVDIAGRVVKTIEKPSSSLQLRELNSGMYMVILNMNDGSRQTIKAIKK